MPSPRPTKSSALLEDCDRSGRASPAAPCAAPVRTATSPLRLLLLLLLWPPPLKLLRPLSLAAPEAGPKVRVSPPKGSGPLPA